MPVHPNWDFDAPSGPDRRRSDCDEAESIAQLQAALADAIAAAGDAYRNSTQLIRLLTVLSQPSSSEELVEQTMIVLAQVFGADLTAIVLATDESLFVTTAFGLPHDDPACVVGWPLAGGAAEALSRWQVVEHTGTGVVPADLPPSVRHLPYRSGVWVPMTRYSGSMTGLLLYLLRTTPKPLKATELDVLQSTAGRLQAAIDVRERNTAIERLARSGHRLTQCLDLAALLREAVSMLPELVRADAAALVVVEGTTVLELATRGGHSPEPLAETLDPTELPGWQLALGGQQYRGDGNPAPLGVAGGQQAVLGTPVMRDNRLAALMYAFREGSRPFQNEASEIASIFAMSIGAAMHNGELYHALRNSEDELRHRATHDALTGLANRVLVNHRLNESLAATDDPGSVGLLFCDLDGFKQVNDRLGHEVGDELLVVVAKRLLGGLRQTDLLARFGGDEFVVLLDGVADLAAVELAGRTMVALLEPPVDLGGERIRISASVGGVLGQRGRDTATGMLRDADAAMYEAKHRGRGLVMVFDDTASMRSRSSLELRTELDSALADGQLSLRYQPLVELHTGVISGFEALLRWNHPVRGPVPPELFIPVAEDTGAIEPIGRWVLAEACGQLAAWQRVPGHDHLEISINLSMGQLRSPGFAAEVASVIDRFGIHASGLWFEVTERASIDNATAEHAYALHATGVRFALDDFGMGNSSLGRLKQLPISRIKIDGSFIRNVDAAKVDRAIVRASVAMADALGLSVVAKSIETAQQQSELIAMGCQRGQGYLLAGPLTAEEVTAMLLSTTGPPEAARSAETAEPAETARSA